MSGRFTRLRYDKEAYDEELIRSTDPMLYRLDPNYGINCKRCFAPYGPRAGAQASDSIGEQIDVDSILRGVSKISTKSNKQQIPDPISGYKLYSHVDCSDELESEYTRYTHPAYDIRGLTVRDLRFDYPLQDPQCQIFENFEVNTRLQAKDDHRAIWQVPFNQRDLLPTERLGKVKNCVVNSNCNYAPYTS
uniref:Uncharacterized protein n=1 Tax=viral metagenome TaxID=1070528 RepID=A0A6C0LTU2_9ZZZZ